MDASLQVWEWREDQELLDRLTALATSAGERKAIQKRAAAWKAAFKKAFSQERKAQALMLANVAKLLLERRRDAADDGTYAPVPDPTPAPLIDDSATQPVSPPPISPPAPQAMPSTAPTAPPPAEDLAPSAAAPPAVAPPASSAAAPAQDTAPARLTATIEEPQPLPPPQPDPRDLELARRKAEIEGAMQLPMPPAMRRRGPRLAKLRRSLHGGREGQLPAHRGRDRSACGECRPSLSVCGRDVL